MYVWFGTPKSDQRSIAPHDIVKLFNLTDSICLSITLLVTLCYASRFSCSQGSSLSRDLRGQEAWETLRKENNCHTPSSERLKRKTCHYNSRYRCLA